MKSGLLYSLVGCCITGAFGFYIGSHSTSIADPSTPTATLPLTPPMHIALVDMARIWEKYPPKKSSENALNAVRAEAKTEWQRLNDSGDKSAATRFTEKRTKEIEAESAGLRAQLVTELQTLITKRAAKSGFTLVLDSSGKSLNGVPIVFHATGIPDITEDILHDYNQ